MHQTALYLSTIRQPKLGAAQQMAGGKRKSEIELAASLLADRHQNANKRFR
jgi:hypothetical protein